MIRDALIYLLCALVVGTGAWGLYDKTLPGQARAQNSVLSPLTPPFAGVKRLRLVIIGADDRKNLVGRSDTLMVLFLSPPTQRAVLLSIPRDLRVTIPGHGFTKVNAAYAWGGPPLTCKVVEQLLHQPLDGYIEVNLQGFVKAIDILHGVVINVEDREGKGRGMNYDCPQDGLVIHLRPGRQLLNGYKAMGYVRYRKSDVPGKGDTDFERAARQQKFIKALIAQKVKVSNLPDLARAGREIWSCLHTTLTWRQGLDLARFMRRLPPGGLKSMTVPVANAPTRHVYYCALQKPQFHAMLADIDSFLQGQPTGPCCVEVLNGSGISGAATTAAKRLTTAGFKVMDVGNAPAYGQRHTHILYRVGSAEAATRAVRTLGCGTTRQLVSAGPGGPATPKLQITIGRDFGHAHASPRGQ